MLIFISPKYLSKMVKFIGKHHKNDETIFWPDLTSQHYAKKKTLEWLEQKNTKIVAKADNPSEMCLTQTQPISNVWALLARAVCARGWEAKNGG
jgi:peptidyl-tRNA hydrolase